MASPRLSVLMIVFNHEPFLRQAVDSAISQKTEFTYEVVIGEDCSSDGSRNILRKYESQFPDRVRLLLPEQNLGMHRNLAQTLDACQGEYIAFLEGDDYWTDALKLHKQVELMDNHPGYAGTFHETQVINDDGTFGKIAGRDAPELIHAVDTITPWAPFHTSSFLVRKEALSFPDWLYEEISLDMALFSIAAAFGPLRKLPETMSVYRRHAGGITRTPEAVDDFYQKRAELMRKLNWYHHGRYAERTEQVVQFLTDYQNRDLSTPVVPSYASRLRRKLSIRKSVRRLFN